MRNRKGFVVSAVLYPLLVIFLALMMGLLSMSTTRKKILENMKNEVSDTIFDTSTCDCEKIGKELKELGEKIAKKYGLQFLYRDFRVGFREGQTKARELGLYMQKYCGCIFSEEDRYSKQIEKDKEKG